MALVAIGWQVYSVRENPLDLGLVGLAEFLPLLLLALPAGQLADRIPRTAAARGHGHCSTSSFLLGLLGVTIAGADQVWPFFVLAFLLGVAARSERPQDGRSRLRSSLRRFS